MSESGSRTRQFFTIAAVSLVIILLLGELYSRSIGYLKTSPWVAVLVAHASLSFLLYLIRKPVRHSLRFKGGSLIPWLATPIVLVGAYLLAEFTPKESSNIAIPGASNFYYSLATLTLIPFFEEIVFRCGVSPFLERFASGWWSAWFSAIVFSVAHTFPTWIRVVTLEIGLPLGPFLLGLCCEYLVRKWGKVGPAIAFHAACNATLYIFAEINPGWLKRLADFYL